MNRNTILLAFLIGGGAVALLFLGIIGTAAFVVYRKENTPDKIYTRANQQGNDYYKEHRLHEAVKEYGKMVTACPDRSAGYYYRAQVEAELREYDAAIADFNSAITREPSLEKRSIAYFNITRCYEEKKDWSHALENADKMEKVGGFNQEANYHRATCYEKLKQYDKADREWTVLVDAYPDAVSMLDNRALERLHAKNYPGAEEDCRSMIRRQNAYSHGWGLLGRVKYEQGNYKEAIENCRQALLRAPYYHSTAFNLALCYAVTGDAEAARKQYRKSLERATPERITAAEEDLRNALQKQPDSALIKEEIALLEKAAPRR